MNSAMELHAPTEGSPPCVLCLLTTIPVTGGLAQEFLHTFGGPKVWEEFGSLSKEPLILKNTDPQLAIGVQNAAQHAVGDA